VTQQLDWVAQAGDPGYKRRISFDHIVVDPGAEQDPLRPQITITRTEGKVTEIDLAPPEGHTFSLFVTAAGAIHIAIRPIAR
jgi:hypothetical protein